MRWWPFGKKEDGKSELNLDDDLKNYYDKVIETSNVREDPKARLSPSDYEKVSTIQSVAQSVDGQRQKTLKQIALDNCVEYEKAYSNCLLNGTYFERFNMCNTERTMYDKCKDMQSQALTVLGFTNAPNDEQRKLIKMRADDLMIAAAPSLKITTAQDEKFMQLLEAEKKKNTN